MYQVNIQEGYIVSIVEGASTGNITEEEYNNIFNVISNKPVPEQGYDYRLKEDLTWELFELPLFESTGEEDANEFIVEEEGVDLWQ